MGTPEKNNQSKLDIFQHLNMEDNFEKEAIKSLKAEDVFNVIISEIKEQKKNMYVLDIKNAYSEYKTLEKEIKELRDNPDIPEDYNHLTGQQINPPRISPQHLNKIKEKVRRIDAIVNAVKDARNNNFSGLDALYHSKKK